MSFMTTAGCRLRQSFIRLGRRLRPAREPTVEEGPGSICAVAQLIRSNRLGRALLATGPEAGPWSGRLRRLLEENDVSFAVREAASATAEEAETLAAAFRDEGCDCFIALGGAGTIDLVKAAAACAAGRGRALISLVGQGRVGRRTPPVIAVPTAASSGAEALDRAAVTDEEGHVFLLEDPALTPAYAVLDPVLIEELPRPALAAAVLDGLCLAVEAYLSGYAGDHARRIAAEAVRAFFETGESCWNSGGSVQGRGRLMEAFRLAGTAASSAGTGYVRAMADAARNAAGLEAAAVLAPILPAVLAKYGNSALPDLALESGVCEGGSRAERTEAFIARIRGLCFRIDLPETLEGLTAETASEIADMAAAACNPRCACPVVWSPADLARILRAAADN